MSTTPTMIEAYLSGLTELFNKLDNKSLEQQDITQFKETVMDKYPEYEAQLIKGESAFRESTEFNIVQQTFRIKILFDVIDTRYSSIIRFTELMHTTIQDVNSLRKLRNETMSVFTHAKENERIALYTLHLSGACSTDVSLTILNDPSVKGYLDLLDKKKQTDN